MQGLVFTWIERFLIDSHGDAVCAAALAKAGFADAEPWVAPLHYPDQQFTHLIHAAAAQTGQTREEFLHDAARWCVPLALHRLAAVTGTVHDPIELLENLAAPGSQGLRQQWRSLLPTRLRLGCEVSAVDLHHARLRCHADSEGLAIIAGVLDGLAAQAGLTAMRIARRSLDDGAVFELSCEPGAVA